MVADAINLSYDADMSDFAPLPTAPLDARLAAIEQALNVTLTVRDLTGWLRGPDGKVLINSRYRSHQQHTVCASGFTSACVQHCRHAASAALRTQRSALVTCCWKHVREVLVPVIRHATLHGYLFAGMWRDATVPTDVWASAWRQLPLWDEARSHRIATVLTTLVDGLWHAADEARNAPLSDDRQGRIRSFIRANLARGRIGLARHLGLSPSRTSHAVRESCGVSLQRLLMEERVAAAQRLLADSELSIADIGARIGWNDAPHFTRLFRRSTGLPPGAWRSMHRNA